MNKFGTNLICSLIPNKKKREKVRKILLKSTPVDYNVKKELQEIKYEIDNDTKNIIRNIKINNIALKMHSEIFPKYRGIYRNRDIVIVGCGPTAKEYQMDFGENPVYISINRAFKIKSIKFDYLFFQDQFMEGFNELSEYKRDDCKKFQGIITQPDCNYVVTQEATTKTNPTRYVLSPVLNGLIPYDIAYEPFADLGGTVFSAIQFALYTNPRRIYLVGFDCTNINYFTNDFFDYSYQIRNFEIMKKYSDYHYPSTEIISVNPIGLKGLFRDIYTQNFYKNSEN